jgi:hypothetical protein
MALKNVSELVGAELDYAVAMADGGGDAEVVIIGTVSPRRECQRVEHDEPGDDGWWRVFAPSRDWAQGGQIIERERIGLMHHTYRQGAELSCVCDAFISGHKNYSGQTPLIAAMRAFVASKLGDTVEL